MKGDFSRETFDKRKHYASVLMQQGRVQVDADWNEQQAIVQHRMQTIAADLIGLCGVPRDNPGFHLQIGPDGADLSISPGRIYVDGILCELEDEGITCKTQPDYPGFTVPPESGRYIAYLDVWLRHFTALDDPLIKETALGGAADTCTRAKIVWQVKLVPSGDWHKLTARGGGELSARAQSDSAVDPAFSPRAKYRGLENQLYRVEIHRVPGDGGSPTFKWSRDNGSVVVAIELDNDGNPKVNGDKITVHSLGLDRERSFDEGQWIEIIDDNTELLGTPRDLYQIRKVLGEKRILQVTQDVVLNPPIGGHPKVRRWDQRGGDGAAIANGIQLLEDGIEVSFTGGPFKAGDYWLIPARSAKGDIEWPVDADNKPIAQPPVGVKHHYCRLAEIVVEGQRFKSVSDLRGSFNPLAENLVAGVLSRENGSNVLLTNGSQVSGNELAQGLTVLLNRKIDFTTATRAACFVTLELPVDENGNNTTSEIVGYRSLVLAADIGISDESVGIAWNPKQATKEYLQKLSVNQESFLDDWKIHPQDGDADWKYAGTGVMATVRSVDTIFQNFPDCVAAINNKVLLRDNASHLEFSARILESDSDNAIIGFIFNFENAGNFCAVYTRVSRSRPDAPKTVVTFVQEQSSGDPSKQKVHEPLSLSSEQNIEQIDIRFEAQTVAVSYKGIGPEGEQPMLHTINPPIPLRKDLQFGLLSSFKKSGFVKFQISYRDTTCIVLPHPEAGLLLGRVTVKPDFLQLEDETKEDGSEGNSLASPRADFSMWFQVRPKIS